MTTRAFGYLMWRTGRNRFVSQLKRVKQPRYALALLIGFAYLGFMIWGRMMADSMPSQMPHVSAPQSPMVALAPVGIALILLSVWVFGSELDALAFTQAEVAMLFTAPVTRRELIVYKLARMQIGILISAAIWVFILRRSDSALPGLAMLVATWVLFATLGLHRLGAALVRAASYEHRKDAKKRNWMPAVFSIVFALGIISAMSDGGEGGHPFAFLDTIAARLETPAFRVALYPFRMMVAPTFAPSLSVWLGAIVPAVALLAVHVLWVLRTDTAFEEAAAEASERRARQIDSLRQRRGGLPLPTSKPSDRTILLAPTGHPALAIVWKNMLALKRQWSIGTIVRPLVIALVLSFTALRSVSDPAVIVAIVALYLTAMLIFAGGQTLRNDLRSDMLHLPFLKTLPLSGRDLVLAEVASSAMPLAAMQFLLVAIAAGALSVTSADLPVPASIRAGLLIAAPFVLLAINGAMLSVNNGMAVLFPGWLRLGPTGAGGFEMIGQAMLAMSAMLLGFILLLVLPAIGGIGAFWFLRAVPLVATAGAGIVGAALLVGEVYLMLIGLGRAFERAEPQQIT